MDLKMECEKYDSGINIDTRTEHQWTRDDRHKQIHVSEIQSRRSDALLLIDPQQYLPALLFLRIHPLLFRLIPYIVANQYIYSAFYITSIRNILHIQTTLSQLICPAVRLIYMDMVTYHSICGRLNVRATVFGTVMQIFDWK